MVSHLTRMAEPIPKPTCYDAQHFRFLNIEDGFVDWNQTGHGLLWAYNLNYMDWLEQSEISVEESERWIDDFLAGLQNNKIGLHPYPLSLRIVNWIRFLTKHPECKNEKRISFLYSQVLLLNKTLEYRLLGNHLLENGCALFMASIFFADKKLYKKASKLLLLQLEEQILKDGAHFEQSPMYHCILLDRLMDCYNLSVNNTLFVGQSAVNDYLRVKAEMMLGHLESVIFDDGSIPLLNDSANGIAPSVLMLFDYAIRLGLKWSPIPMKECGYRKMNAKCMEAIIDIGNITASYQPGHSHADTFNYVLRIGGAPFVVDTGISTYDKNERRQYERSTMAHNTVVVDGEDTSHVWGGFRVGKRCKVKIYTDSPKRIEAILCSHDKKCQYNRSFMMEDDAFVITDERCSGGNAVSYIHFANGISVEIDKDNKTVSTQLATIYIDGAKRVEVVDGYYSEEYNKMKKNKILMISFDWCLKYAIKIKN